LQVQVVTNISSKRAKSELAFITQIPRDFKCRNQNENISAKNGIKRKENIRRRGRSRSKRRRGGVKSSELDKKTCVLVKGIRVSGVRQSADKRLPK